MANLPSIKSQRRLTIPEVRDLDPTYTIDGSELVVLSTSSNFTRADNLNSVVSNSKLIDENGNYIDLKKVFEDSLEDIDLNAAIDINSYIFELDEN